MDEAIFKKYGISLTAFTICVVAGVLVAAFAIWLTVRIIARRERWAKRTAVAATLALVVYALSWGPALYVYQSNGRPAWMDIPIQIYTPLAVLLNSGRPWFLEPYRRYIFGCMVDERPRPSVNPPASNPDAPPD